MSNKFTFILNVSGNCSEQLQDISAAIQKVAQQVESTSTAFDKLGNFSVRMDAFSDVVRKSVEACDMLVGSSLEFEQQQANLKTLLNGDAEAADRLVNNIREYGKATVYDRSSLVEAQKTMMAFGLEADFAFGKLKNIGDIALGDSEKMKSLSLAFAQTTSTGKLMGQDLLQMINAGFNPLEVISQKTGKSIATLKDEMSKGAISAEMVAQAFEWATEEGGRFYGGAESAAKTTTGKIAKMKDSIDEMKVSLFETTHGLTAYIAEIGKMAEPFSVFIPLIAKLISKIKELPGIFSNWGTQVKKVLQQMTLLNIKTKLQHAWTVIVAGATKAWAAVQTIFNAICSLNPLGIIIIAVTAAIAVVIALVKTCISHFESWGSAILLLMGPIGIIVNMFMSFKRHWDSIKAAFSDGGIIAGLKRIGFVLFDAILMPVQQLLQLVSKVPGLGHLAGKGSEKVSEWREKLDKITEPQTKTSEVLGTNEALQKAVTNGTGSGSTGSTTSQTKASTEAVATGGTRNTTVNIKLDNMIGQITYNSSTRESVAEVQRVFAEAMNRILGMAQTSMG